MEFPDIEMLSASQDWFHARAIAAAVVKARPDLAELIAVSDDRPMVRLPLRSGAIVAAKMQDRGVTRWNVAAPSGPVDVTLVAPVGIENIAGEMIIAYDRLSGSDR